MVRKFILFSILVCLFGCIPPNSATDRTRNEYKTYDNNGLSRSDYYDTLDAPKKKHHKNEKTNVLNKTKLMAIPKQPSQIPDKLVSISVTEDIPLKEVLLEIGRMANLDIQISPKIDASIIFTAKNKPLYDVLNNITEIANVRYKIVNGIIVFEVDDPYVETYSVHFLSLDRTGSSSKSVSTSVGGSSQSSSSSFSLSSKSEDKLWDDLLSGLSQIVSEEVLNDRKIAEAKKQKEQKEQKETMGMMQMPQQQNSLSSDMGSSGPPSNGVTIGSGVANVLSAAATQPLPPLNPQQQNNSQGGSGSNNQQQNGQMQSPLGKDTISVNKRGGLVAIYANKKAHQKISAYLKLLHKKVMSQVLIEVKILEVTLNNQYINGIDWSSLSSKIGSSALTLASGFATYGLSATTTLATTAAVFTVKGGDINGTIRALNNFGTVRTIISPRLNATNNQQAVLSRAQNDVYFNMSITNNFVNNGTNINQGTTAAAQQFTVSATPQTIANGINLTVQPAIDFEKREIIMNVRPMISSITDKVQDPGFAYIVAQSKLTGATETNGLQNNIPVTVSKEFDTIVKVKDGEMMIMGGFTQNVVSITESGVPFLSEIPFFGMLFKQRSSSESVVETVLLIKATIVDDGEDNLHEADKKLYNKLANYSRKEEL